MKFSTGIFFLILLSICYVAESRNAFTQVKALLGNLKQSNVKDQRTADIRQKEEEKWCSKAIGKAVNLVAKRQADVDDLEKHIKWIIFTRQEARKDRAKRAARIKANVKLLNKFKRQRCDNNLLFVKQLREHMNAVAVMKLLRGDIIKFFNSKKAGQRGVFLEQFGEYIALLDEKHKQMFTELKTELTNYRPHELDRTEETRIKTRSDKSVNTQGNRLTAQGTRTSKQIGTGHIDNTRGALKKLATPEHEEISEYNKKTRTKILRMIDGLIKHLRESRRKLTRDEIHAAEDFAIFHNNLEQENEYLANKIKQITKEINNLTNQLNVAKSQLVKRKRLRDQAKLALKLLRKMCREKEEYFKKETRRRNDENKTIDFAMALFNKILTKLSARVRARASNINNGEKLTHEMTNRVVKNAGGEKEGLSNRVSSRNDVVF